MAAVRRRNADFDEAVSALVGLVGTEVMAFVQCAATCTGVLDTKGKLRSGQDPRGTPSEDPDPDPDVAEFVVGRDARFSVTRDAFREAVAAADGVAVRQGGLFLLVTVVDWRDVPVPSVFREHSA